MMEQERGCESCRAKDWKHMEKIGKTEHNEYLGGKAHEDIDYYRCLKCGTNWQWLRESGAGGRGKFWTVT